MPNTDAAWTIDQLTERVADALAAGYPGQSSGRVREVPNVRTIRWYTTIGLLDRPTMRGRTALYGPRHLAQIVAIKRLQAEGSSLTEVQEQLIGADDATLARIARLPEARQSFWAAPPAAPARRAATAGAAAESSESEEARKPAPALAPVHGVRLSGDVTLLLTAARQAPDEAARRAIEDAARPLLDQLRRLGLTAA